MICNTYVQFFQSLADSSRLEIINILRKGPLSVSEISANLNFEQSRASHNLRKLKEFGFVKVQPNGKQRIYRLEEKTIVPLLNLIDEHVDRYYHHYCKCKGDDKKKRWRTRS